MSTAARRWRGAPALVIVSLLLVLPATLMPRGGTLAEGAARFCLWCGDTRVTDAIANIVLFLPLGFALVMNGARPRTALALCGALTLVIEATQYAGVPAGRIASLSDGLTNAAGGAIGAGIARRGRDLLWPRAPVAVRLALSWALLCSAVLGATAWAVSTPTVPPGAVPAPKISALPVTPGFGWYHGTVIGTLVDGIELPHRGDGPVIVEAPVGERRTVRVALTGRDERGGPVPFLYVHPPRETRSQLLLLQRGADVVLRAASRGTEAGLSSPETSVPGAFATDRMRPGDTTLVIARVSPRELSVVVQRSGQRWSAAAPRTLTIGWALVQSLVTVSSRAAGALTALWLLLLLLPVGYWGWWAGPLRAYVTLGAAAGVAVAATLAVRGFGIAFPSLLEWCTLAGGLALGMLAGQVALAYRHEIPAHS